MLKYKILILFLLFSFSTLIAQRAVRKADDAFALRQYNYAITLYQKALPRVKKDNLIERNRINFQVAECRRLSGDYKRAVMDYRRAIRAKYYDVEPVIYLRLADIHKFMGEYEDAVENYKLYLEIVSDDQYAENQLKMCETANEWLNNPTKYNVSIVKRINSRQNDWAPRYLDVEEQFLTFTSSRTGATGKKLDDWTGQKFTDLFISAIDKKGEWGAPTLIDEAEVVNTEANEADAFFIGDGSTAFFTLCANEKKKQSGCLVYQSNYDGNEWSQPTPIILTTDSLADCVHPFLTPDGRTIFFSSNMEGGEGDLDIWYATRGSLNDNFGTPVNIGKNINTTFKESWPFLRNDTTLYFASTGHAGMGGYDIFRCVKRNGQWDEPENMQVPVNSSSDDFGIIFSRKADEHGFFSSNRTDGSGGDDIYEFDLPTLRFSIAGTVKDENTLQPIADAIIQIVGSDGLNVQTNTDKKGFFLFDATQIKKDVTYKIWSSKAKYFEQEVVETTVGLTNSKEIIRDFSMTPIPRGAIVLPDILYDLAKWDLKVQYQDSLIGLIQLLENNPRLVIELASHTDNRPIAMTNDSLSQYRAQEVVKYLIERGINPGRLVAKGYGSQKPRSFDIDRVFRNGRDTFFVPALTVLSESYINSIPKNFQEIAHQANRRTEFSILREDFIPPQEDVQQEITNIESLVTKGDIEEDKRIYYTINPSGHPEFEIVVNGVSFTFVYDSTAKDNKISWNAAMRLLRTGKLTKNDFDSKERAFNEDSDIIIKSRLTIKQINIKDKILSNISLIVEEELPAPFILNKDILKQLGKFTVNTQEQCLQME